MGLCLIIFFFFIMKATFIGGLSLQVVLNRCGEFLIEAQLIWNLLHIKLCCSECPPNVWSSVRLQAPSRRFQSKQLKSALPLKLVKSWSVSPALCTLFLVRKLWIAPEWVFPFTKQRHSNWLSWEGYCKDKRKCVCNCFDFLGEIKETLESRAKVYISYSFKKIPGV